MRLVRRRGFSFYAGALAAFAALLALVLPVPYVIESPGPTLDVLGKADDGRQVIAVEGAATHGSKGRLLLVTVNAMGIPGSPVLGAETLVAWADPAQKALPSEAVFPTGQTREQYDQEANEEMSGSQSSATDVALSFLSDHGVDVTGVKVTMDGGEIGGPSAGMMYALGTIDKLTEDDLTGGLTIAGTGTIDADGKVGAIGGIELKMKGALRDGATWFLAPSDNCSEVVGNVPDGLRDVKVSTLDEAYDALTAIARGDGDSLPRCAA